METVTEMLGYKTKKSLIADIVREQIAQCNLNGGDKLLPDAELAGKYKVNKRTVAAGLNELVREGILERAPGRGTIVIRGSDKNKLVTNAVALIMLSKGDVYSNISREISRQLVTKRFFSVLINEHVISDKHCVEKYLDAMVSESHRPYGFVIDGSLEFPFEYLKSNLKRFENIVFINKYHHHEKIKSAKYALLDFTAAGRIAAQHFIRQGHKKLACLAVHEKSYSGHWSSMQVMIMNGFAETCRDAKVDFDEAIFWKLLHGAPLKETVGEILSGKERLTALFAYPDSFIRYDIIPLIHSIGLKPMNDIELIGFYNTHHAEECGFSSICINEKQIADAAAQLLLAETPEQQILIQPELIIRHPNK